MATAGVRLVLSGVFDKYPGLKIVLGHLGEGLPFLLWRVATTIDDTSRGKFTPANVRELFCEHFYVTTSGFCSDPALLCTMWEMGADRILFAIDWPYVDNAPGTAWMDNVSISREDREKILNGNAKRLLKME